MRHTALTACILGAASLLAGCDALGIESASSVAARKEAEGKAIGSACRHAVRSIEDCFGGYPRAGKAAVFTGWKEMDEYMRENAIVGMPAEPAPAAPAPAVSPGVPDGSKPATASRNS